jgi:uncharacterized protein DUF669
LPRGAGLGPKGRIIMSENGTQGVDYLSLDGLVTSETRAWGGETGAGLPPGDYKAKITEVVKDTSTNNNPQLVVQFEVLEGEHKSRKTRCWYTLTERAIGRLVNLLEAVGMKLDQKKGFAPKAMVGRELVIGVFEDKYEVGGANGMTGEKEVKTSTKVFNERKVTEWPAIAQAQAAKVKSQQPSA